ncbi:MAG: hypothetical protein FWG90_05560 [Oscillospiraceae bacterium]|nr:hypothetical protein [Oscillospiraceae bacterium]
MTHSIEIMRDRRDRKWLNEGIQTGIQTGIQRGKLEAAIENAVRMIKEGLSFDMIKRVTNLPDEELRQLWTRGED